MGSFWSWKFIQLLVLDISIYYAEVEQCIFRAANERKNADNPFLDALLRLLAIECVIQDWLASLCARHCGELWDAKRTGTELLTAQIPSKSLPPRPLLSMHFKQSNYFIHEDGEAKIWKGRETKSLVAYFIKCRLARHEKAVFPQSSCFSTQSVWYWRGCVFQKSFGQETSDTRFFKSLIQ